MTSDRPYDDFLRMPEAKSVKNRLYLELRGTDLAAATEQGLLLGATRACSGRRPDREYIERADQQAGASLVTELGFSAR